MSENVTTPTTRKIKTTMDLLEVMISKNKTIKGISKMLTYLIT